MDEKDRRYPPTTFVFSNQTIKPTANPVSVINSHVATVAHRRRRDAKAKQLAEQQALAETFRTEHLEPQSQLVPLFLALKPSQRIAAKAWGPNQGPRPRTLAPKPSLEAAPSNRMNRDGGIRTEGHGNLVSAISAATISFQSYLYGPDLVAHNPCEVEQSCSCDSCVFSINHQFRPFVDTNETSDSSWSPPPPSWVGSFDPLNNFPMQIDSHGHSLVHHCKSYSPF
jgi:hypothetical protein